MSYRKLKQHSDNGHIYYSYEGEGLATDGSTKKSLGISLMVGHPIKVRWPNGEITQESIESHECATPKNDHGVESVVKSEIFIIKITHLGAACFIDLDGLEIYDASDEGEWSLL